MSCDVYDVVIVKAANNMRDCVALTNIGQELIAQAFAFASTGNQTGNVHEFHDSGNDAGRMHNVGKLLQSVIRYFHDSDVGFDGAERIVFGGNARLGQSVENSGLADVRQANDATF